MSNIYKFRKNSTVNSSVSMTQFQQLKAQKHLYFLCVPTQTSTFMAVKTGGERDANAIA